METQKISQNELSSKISADSFRYRVHAAELREDSYGHIYKLLYYNSMSRYEGSLSVTYLFRLRIYEIIKNK